MKQVTIEYFGHSCFRLTGCTQRVVLDPYEDGCVPGCPDLRLDAEFVYCSHGHHDHNAVQCVTLRDGGAPRFAVTELETDHDDAGGSKRGKNMIRVFDFDGVRIAHFGDLGRPLTAAETAALRGLDCALIPVGGFFTIDAHQAADIAADIAPRTVIPMHYRTGDSGFDVIASIDDALPAFAGRAHVVTMVYGGKSVVMQGDADAIETRSGAFHAKGCNCCQSVLCTLDSDTGLPEQTAVRVGYGFGGGLLTGNVCGAVSGAMMAIGLACTSGADPAAEKPGAVALCEALQARFQEEFGTLLCADLLEKNGHALCDYCIAFAAYAAEKIIRENKS